MGGIVADGVVLSPRLGEAAKAGARFGTIGLAQLPEVDILYLHQDRQLHLFDADLAGGAAGLVPA